MAYVIKVKYGDDLCVLKLKSKPRVGDLSYTKLEGRIRSLHDLPAERQIRVTYNDEDKDVITMKNDHDVEDALSIQPLGPLRLYVSLVEPESMALDVVSAAAAAAATQGDNLVGAPLSKKPRRSQIEELVSAEVEYLEKLLEPLADLPETAAQLREVLVQTPVKLPVRERIYGKVRSPELLTCECPKEVEDFTILVETALEAMVDLGVTNEATSSASLFHSSGRFIKRLNDMAPRGRRLQNVSVILDSPNANSTQTASQALERLARPDLQLFVKGCLILRWENKLSYSDLPQAVHENSKKLKAWSPLFYGALPYVIGGCCAGNQFRWLRLRPGEKGIIDHEFISPNYDLNSLRDVVAFLHSNIRMHCLLQKLQEHLKDGVKLILYLPMDRGNDVTVTIYPHIVKKEILEDDVGMRPSLYTAIKHSKYLIHGEVRRLRKTTVLLLEPVGDPESEPVTLKELENATHDILCGFSDLHKAGYIHRDVRWENCVKVSVEGEWKWILIDLEAAGADGEEWNHSPLKGWDSHILEGRTKKYTKASDLYLLGKLICGWLAGKSPFDEKRYQVMKSGAEKMMGKASRAVEVKKLFCKPSCKRCRTFGNDS